MVAERGSTALSAATNTSIKRPAADPPSNQTKRQKRDTRQLLTDCFGDSDEDILNLNSDTDIGGDLSLTIDNVDNKEATRTSPVHLVTVIEDSPIAPSGQTSPPRELIVAQSPLVNASPPYSKINSPFHANEDGLVKSNYKQLKPGDIDSPPPVPFNPFRIPRIAHASKPAISEDTPSAEPVRERQTPKEVAKASHIENRQQQIDKERLSNREIIERRRSFARKHDADLRRKERKIRKQIDDHQQQIDRLTLRIEHDSKIEANTHDIRTRLTLQQYRELRDSPPIGYTSDPDKLREFEYLKLEAKRPYRPALLPGSQPSTEKYVPTPINKLRELIDAQPLHKINSYRSSPSAAQQAHHKSRHPPPLDQRSHPSVTTSIGHAAVSAVYATRRNQSANRAPLPDRPRDQKRASAIIVKPAAIGKHCANCGSGNSIDRPHSIEHRVTISTSAPLEAPGPSNSATAVVSAPQKKKKKGRAQRMRIRKAIAREADLKESIQALATNSSKD